MASISIGLFISGTTQFSILKKVLYLPRAKKKYTYTSIINHSNEVKDSVLILLKNPFEHQAGFFVTTI